RQAKVFVQQVPIEVRNFGRLKHILKETKSFVQRPDSFSVLRSTWCSVAAWCSVAQRGVLLIGPV
ncbi:MAG: hypothetical protein QOJ42_3737, partial [Acidobacteriaceae bacterium]|nr:hypothetical protein [Acidobacteriaceae bacterium]